MQLFQVFPFSVKSIEIDTITFHTCLNVYQKQPPKVLYENRPATLLKKRLWHRCFHVNFAKFSRTSFLQNSSERLLLTYAKKIPSIFSLCVKSFNVLNTKLSCVFSNTSIKLSQVIPF